MSFLVYRAECKLGKICHMHTNENFNFHCLLLRRQQQCSFDQIAPIFWRIAYLNAAVIHNLLDPPENKGAAAVALVLDRAFFWHQLPVAFGPAQLAKQKVVAHRNKHALHALFLC